MRRAGRIALQVALVAIVAVFIWRSLSENWDEFSAIEFEFHFRPEWILLSAFVVWSTYAIQIASWRTILAGWQQRIGYRDAARAWCLANLGRYVPGKLWSIAGLVVLAQRAGVGRLILFHHDPDRTDDAVDRIVEEVRQEFSNADAAREGMRFPL